MNPSPAVSRSKLDLRALALFFLLAYAISWATWTIPIVPSLGPMLAAAIVAGVTAGPAGLRSLLSGLAQWRVGLRWWLVAASPVAVLLLSLSALRATGQRLSDSTEAFRYFGGPGGLAVVWFVLATVAASVGEEVGWRGYALPALQRRFRPLPASLILAVLWWMWHLEFFLLDNLPLAGFPAYLIEVTAVAIILTWLYNRSGGSILLVVDIHAAYNAVSFTALTTTVVTLMAILLGMLLVVLELHAGRHGRSVLGESPIAGVSPNLLNLLADTGIGAGDTDRFDVLLYAVLAHQEPSGRFLPRHVPGTAEPVWGSLLRDSHAILEVLILFTVEPSSKGGLGTAVPPSGRSASAICGSAPPDGSTGRRCWEGPKALPRCAGLRDARQVSSVERLSAEDRLILWPDAMWPQDIGALGVLAGNRLLDSHGRFRIEAVKQAIEGRLHLLPRFRQVLYTPSHGLGGPLWVDAPRFNLDDHIHVERLDAPAEEAELLRAVARLRRRALDRSRPLWEMWFLTGMSGDRIGWFARLHHVVADGIAGVAELVVLLDQSPDTAWAQARPWAPAPRPSGRALLQDSLQRQMARLTRALGGLTRPATTLRRARAAIPALRELLAEEPGPRTSLNRVIGRDRTLAVLRSSLESVDEAAHLHGARVNDVLLAVIAGGLRGLLRSRGEPIESVTLPIYVPVSLRRGRSVQDGGNLISQMLVPLPLGIVDPGQRLRQIALETAKRKAIGRVSLGTMFRNRLVRGAMLKLIIRQRVNVVSADLPGPRTPRYFAGARLIEVFPLLNLVGNESLGVGALSYAGQFNIMAVGDADAYPDLDVFAASAREDLRTLLEATSQARGRRART